MTTPVSKSQQVANWHQRWHGMLLRTLSKRLAGVAEVQDLAQEVYLRMLRVDNPDLIRHPKSYLYRVAVNVAEEWRQRAAQSRIHSPDDLDGLASDSDPESEAERSRRQRDLLAALENLPLACRTAVVLHVRDGMTYTQIADHMGVSHRMVKRYVGKAYAVLRRRLPHLAQTNRHHE